MLPIQTSIRPRHTPYANYGLIAANLVVFLLSYHPHVVILSFQKVVVPVYPWAEPLMLIPQSWRYWQFLTYAFLHANWLHILGNMFFLFMFGNNVNDKLGHTGYVCFYLAGSVFSGIGHALMRVNPAMGASGAVAAVTGAYLVLFPQTLITVFYWFFYFINTIDISALYFIGIKLIFWDNVAERSMPNVAYDAHLSGYAFGILSMLIMLASGLISSSHLDLWAMIKRWNRRRVYRDVVSGGYDPYTGQTKSSRVKVKDVVKSASEKQKEERIVQLRSEISNRIMQRNLPAAAETYIELMEEDSEQILPGKQLLDIANQLAGENKHAESARAYEQFLSHYGTYEYSEQVELMLGVIYSRYLNQPELAVKHLQIAEKKLIDPGQLKMCRDELARIQNA